MKSNQSSLRTFLPSQPAHRAPAGSGAVPRVRPGGPIVLLTLLLSLAASQAELSVTDGLMLWLKADEGVVTNAAAGVTDWADASMNLNDAAQHGEGLAPLWVPNAINGLPAVRFDGVDDYLEIATATTLQPLAGDWTVIFVGRRLGGSQGDYPQVIGSRPWTNGTDKGWAVGYSGTGVIGSHFADGTAGHDVPGVAAASPLSTSQFEMWQIEENRAAGTTSFFKNGDPDQVLATAMPTSVIDQPDPIRLGRELGGSDTRRANLELAEVLVFNRSLTRAEREAVSTYLSQRYNFGFSPDTLPTVSVTSPADGTSLVAPATFTFSATAADSDGTIRQVEFLVNGTPVATATQPPFTVPLRTLVPGTLTLTAAATDNRGERVVSAPVTLTLTQSGGTGLTVDNELRLWLAADAGVATNLDGQVTDWADQSPLLNDALQHEPGLAPTWVADAANGLPVLRFDGVDDYLEIANTASLQPLTGSWTVFFVGERRAGSQGDWPQVIGARPWTAGFDKGWSVVFGTSGLLSSHYADGTGGHDVNTPGVGAASAWSGAAFQVWQVEENRSASTTAFYVGGQLDRGATSAMPAGSIDQTDPIRIGRDIGGSNNRRASMDLAEVLIYGRALENSERETVTAYLSAKYHLPCLLSQNSAPTVALTAPAAGQIFGVPTNITLTAAAADSDGSIASVQFYRGTTFLGTVTTSPYSLSVSNGSPGTLTYSAVATDNLGATTRSVSVTITNVLLNPPTPAPIDTARGLISLLDYTDTFTVGTTARPDGLYNDNTQGGYGVETPVSNPASTWLPISGFSFNAGEVSTCCGYPGNGSQTGAATGLGQSGGGDFSLAYGLRSSYVVSVDAILPGDRLDISSMPGAGASLFSANSLSVFFRRSPGGIGIFNGSAETLSGVTTGVTDNNWHNYAVHFDQANQYLGLFVDGVLLTNLDLTLFAGGTYLNYANAAVGLGGAGGVFWVDNFKVGAAGRLLRALDFRDTFTVGTAARPDGLYNNNATGGYALESDPARTWTPFQNFSFNTGAGSTCCGYPGNLGNSGAAGGLAQSGGNDFSFEYGVRSSYVVEVDAILPGDRFDLSSLPNAGATIFAANSLSVFFRKDGAAVGIGLFNGSAEANTGATTGVSDSAWHRFGVHFDRLNDRLSLYVDRVLRASLNLATFAGGAYRNYSNAAIGAGGAGGVFWADNFQVGPPEFELSSRVDVARSGSQVAVSWAGPGLLEEASEVTGPWTSLPSARSPYTPEVTGHKFYRLKR